MLGQLLQLLLVACALTGVIAIFFFHCIFIVCGGVGVFIFESEKPSHLLTLALWKVLAAARHACYTELQRVPSQNVKVSLQCAVDVFGTSTNVCELSKKIQNLSMLRGFSIRLQEWPVEIVIEIGGHSVSGSYCTSSENTVIIC